MTPVTLIYVVVNRMKGVGLFSTGQGHGRIARIEFVFQVIYSLYIFSLQKCFEDINAHLIEYK